MIRQIIVITDGCSNVGMTPAAAAAEARAEGIIVNVIGVLEEGELGSRAEREIEEIAAAGGGMSRLAPTRMLSQTVQMMTRKTMTHTIHQVVNRELRNLFGAQAGMMEELPPDQRSKVVKVVDDLTESVQMRVAVLVDASASMRTKLSAVREAVLDLSLSLGARQGHSEIAVFHFPGESSQTNAVLDVPWTNKVAELDKLFVKLQMQGTTPTGPALQEVVRYVVGHRNALPNGMSDKGGQSGKGGMLSEYVV